MRAFHVWLPCMTIRFLNLQITRSDIRSHVKWAVSLVIAYGHLNLPQGFVWVRTYLFYHPEGFDSGSMLLMCVIWVQNRNLVSVYDPAKYSVLSGFILRTSWEHLPGDKVTDTVKIHRPVLQTHRIKTTTSFWSIHKRLELVLCGYAVYAEGSFKC